MPENNKDTTPAKDSKALVSVYASEMNAQLATPEVKRALLATTFKGLSENSMKQAIVEGMMLGHDFKSFLRKDVYAIPFKDGYSLVTSIAKNRKIAAKSGHAGTSAPVYTYNDDGTIADCTVTVKKRVGAYVDDYTATVDFKEYYKAGKNGYPSMWDSKPKTMIAKVAEMHALRKAFPEELGAAYVEEEMEREQSLHRPRMVVNVEDSGLTMGDIEKSNENQDTPETEQTIQLEEDEPAEGGKKGH